MQWLNSPLYADLPHIFWGIFVFIGAACASFFNVLALRWGNFHRKAALSLAGAKNDQALPLMAGRSHCPSCNQQIPIYHNIPLISWLLLRGRSACCNSKISAVYLQFELIGAGVFAAIAWTVGPTTYGLILALAIMTQILSVRILIKDGFWPNGLIIATVWLGGLMALAPAPIAGKDAMTFALAIMALTTVSSLGFKHYRTTPFATYEVILASLAGAALGAWGLLWWIGSMLISYLVNRQPGLTQLSICKVTPHSMPSLVMLAGLPIGIFVFNFLSILP